MKNPIKKQFKYILFVTCLFFNLNCANNLKAQNVSLDPTFNLNPTYSVGINGHYLQNDGKLIIVGSFNTLAGDPHTQVARINSDGSDDISFNADTVLKSVVQCVQVQSDGKIVVGGLFNSIFFQGPSNYIARLNSNGTFDATYLTQSGFDNMVMRMLLQADGKLLVAGYFFNYNGNPCPRIARLNTNGSFDATFVMGTGFNNDVFPMALQTDGKIVAGGSFTTYNGNNCGKIVRLNSNGSMDVSFNVGNGFTGPANYSGLGKILIQPDGKIIALGTFTAYQGNLCNNIARLNTDGSYDTSFVIGNGFDAAPSDAVLQTNGQILISGNFTTYKGSPAPKIIRLTSNGSIDYGFNAGSGFNSGVLLALQTDGKILCSGSQLTQFNGSPCKRVLRLQVGSTTGIPTNEESKKFSLAPNPVKDRVYLKMDEALNADEIQIKIINSFGNTIICSVFNEEHQIGIDLSGQAAGMYLVNIYQAQKLVLTKKIIKED